MAACSLSADNLSRWKISESQNPFQHVVQVFAHAMMSSNDILIPYRMECIQVRSACSVMACWCFCSSSCLLACFRSVYHSMHTQQRLSNNMHGSSSPHNSESNNWQTQHSAAHTKQQEKNKKTKEERNLNKFSSSTSFLMLPHGLEILLLTHSLLYSLLFLLIVSCRFVECSWAFASSPQSVLILD